MSTTPPPKRQKLKGGLHKPFKSPLLASRTGDNPSAPKISSPLVTAPVKLAGSETPSQDSTKGSFEHVPSPSPVLRFNTSIRRSPVKYPSKQAISLADADTDPALTAEIQEIIRKTRSLESQISNAKSEIDVLSQSLRLLTSSKDDDLKVLTGKWSAAARQAAEEVFASARDKVNRMGGVGAWREAERQKLSWRQWDDDEENGKRRQVYDENGDMIERDEEEYDELWKEREKEEDDDSFTMDMMLNMLNIDLDVIGYDKARQRWKG